MAMEEVERQDIKTAIDMLDDLYDADNPSLDNISLNHCVNVLMDCGNEIASLRAKVLALQAALAAKDVELKRFLDSHEECTDFDGFTAQIVSLDDYHEAQEALDIKPGDAEVRKLVAKHVRKAYEYRMTYASQIEDGSAPL